MLLAACAAEGCPAVDLGIVSDDAARLEAALDAALDAGVDVLVTSGTAPRAPRSAPEARCALTSARLPRAA
jgi:molybdopterin biosynthesis enzyme